MATFDELTPGEAEELLDLTLADLKAETDAITSGSG